MYLNPNDSRIGRASMISGFAVQMLNRLALRLQTRVACELLGFPEPAIDW
jgi:hypothetical protein